VSQPLVRMKIGRIKVEVHERITATLETKVQRLRKGNGEERIIVMKKPLRFNARISTHVTELNSRHVASSEGKYRKKEGGF